jgi:hypothetical protein
MAVSEASCVRSSIAGFQLSLILLAEGSSGGRSCPSFPNPFSSPPGGQLMRAIVIAPFVLAIAAVPALAQGDINLDASNSTTLPLPALGGWVLSPDGETLIVSSPKTAEIIYVDTSHDNEIKRVKLRFQPAALAMRGPSLYAVGKGSSLLHVLDAQTGQSKKEIRVPGAKLVQLACHPTSGPLFATNDRYEILAVDTETGNVEKTVAEGNFLAVDLKGDFLYTGTQKPIKDILVLSRGPRRSIRVGVAKTNVNSSVVKYSLKSKEMEPVAMNGSPVQNGRMLAVSPDGQKIALVGGGGMVGGDGKRLYAIPILDTSDLETQLGQVETGAYPTAVGFHPVLELGVAEKSGGVLILFDAGSLAPIKTMEFKTGGGGKSDSDLLTFGGRGTKLLYYHPETNVPSGRPSARGGSRGKRPVGGPDHEGRLYLIPLELTDNQKAALAKSFPAPKG